MSVAERLIMQGREEGRLEGLTKALRRQLCKKFKLDILPSYVEERLAKATEDELDLYAERVLEAKSLDEVFRTK